MGPSASLDTVQADGSLHDSAHTCRAWSPLLGRSRHARALPTPKECAARVIRVTGSAAACAAAAHTKAGDCGFKAGGGGVGVGAEWEMCRTPRPAPADTPREQRKGDTRAETETAARFVLGCGVATFNNVQARCAGACSDVLGGCDRTVGGSVAV